MFAQRLIINMKNCDEERLKDAFRIHQHKNKLSRFFLLKSQSI